ncbi:DUF1189 domain-containing protein [Oceanobacillus caeni]|uniref:4-hydroxy-3-methylbut-2-en-1-yl diphosphate synthase n=1 Tax=Oceanobacillus caeni TaxID=405946 RepID=A0ABR5MH65_9BACI|nr:MULTISPECIES: DUF1189 family protein [Bacillaceae]KKE78301.1 hypothetical protein WH51_13530 [Bacilli bacterium VT-13-104]PZD84893.1 DUF1189 domain-containing protein [Bacilli bacterium]KPH72110.1 hypothetical protein AFL42_13910 [Oceanobacillus caeni]MBU8790857.1 DUF1189 domain-containing protein [Oceanobacillus caeni]MCR1833712.1 DUF1189 domain-containing protein [Oceanobacillus caeni]
MIFWNVFLNSVKLPNKKAMFQLNRVGLDIAIFYILLILFLTSIPSFIHRLTDMDRFGSDMNFVFTLIYFFIFYYLPLTIIVFGIIFITSYLGKLLSKILNRKLHYSLLWKMTAFTITIPFLLYTIISIFFTVDDSYLMIAFIYSAVLLCKMILHYPKRRI